MDYRYIFIGLYFLQACGLVLAIRALKAYQRQARDGAQHNIELRGRNAELLLEIVNNRRETDEARKYYRDLFNKTDQMIFAHEVSPGGGPGKFVEANNITCAALGYSRDELLKMTPLDIEADEDHLPDVDQKAMHSDESSEYMDKYVDMALARSVRRRVTEVLQKGHVIAGAALKTREGRSIPVEVSARALEFHGNPIILCTVQDTTSRLQGEHKLAETQQRVEDFFTLSSFGVVLYDGNRHFIEANPACLRMFGFLDQDEMADFSLFDNPYMPKDVIAKLRAGENITYNMVINYEEAVKNSVCISTRKDRGYYRIWMNNMGYSRGRERKGFFAQILDTTEHHRVAEQLRQLQDSGSPHAKEGIAGSLRDMAFTDMIQVLCAGGKSAMIELVLDEANAEVFINQGNIVHCKLNGTVGADAFYSLMQWRDGDFVTKQCSDFPDSTIAVSTMSLLMEGARLADEGM